MHTRVAFGQNDFSAHFFRLLEPAPRHGNGVLGKGASDPAACAATESAFTVLRHFHKVGRNLSNGVPGFFINTAVSSQVAGVMIGHPFVGTDGEIEILQELGDMDYIDVLFRESFVLGFVVKGSKTVGTAGDDRFGSRIKNEVHVFPGKIRVYVIAHIFQYAAAAHFINQGVIHLELIQKFQGCQGGFIFPVRPHASDKIYNRRPLIPLPFKVLGLVFRINVGVFLKYFVHPFKSGVA